MTFIVFFYYNVIISCLFLLIYFSSYAFVIILFYEKKSLSSLFCELYCILLDILVVLCMFIITELLGHMNVTDVFRQFLALNN